MEQPKLLVLDDYEGELANAPDMLRMKQLAEITILSRPIGAGDHGDVAAIRQQSRFVCECFSQRSA